MFSSIQLLVNLQHIYNQKLGVMTRKLRFQKLSPLTIASDMKFVFGMTSILLT